MANFSYKHRCFAMFIFNLNASKNHGMKVSLKVLSLCRSPVEDTFMFQLTPFQGDDMLFSVEDTFLFQLTPFQGDDMF